MPNTEKKNLKNLWKCVLFSKLDSNPGWFLWCMTYLTTCISSSQPICMLITDQVRLWSAIPGKPMEIDRCLHVISESAYSTCMLKWH